MKTPILVTGATGGVGSTLCRHLASRYRVLAVGRNPALLEVLAHNLPDVATYCADLSRPDQVEALLETLLAEHGHIPRVVNNAGHNLPERLTETATEALETAWRVNALAPFLIMQAVLPGMMANGFGRVVNITSGAPFNCFAGHGAYSASKAALNALTRTAAREHDTHDIKINLMSPGPVRSGMAPSAPMEPAVCLPTLDYLLELDRDGPTGRFFWLGHEIPLAPDHQGIDWLQGRASERFARIPGVQPPSTEGQPSW